MSARAGVNLGALATQAAQTRTQAGLRPRHAQPAGAARHSIAQRGTASLDGVLVSAGRGCQQDLGAVEQQRPRLSPLRLCLRIDQTDPSSEPRTAAAAQHGTAREEARARRAAAPAAKLTHGAVAEGAAHPPATTAARRSSTPAAQADAPSKTYLRAPLSRYSRN
jgi:hypothetical protein